MAEVMEVEVGQARPLAGQFKGMPHVEIASAFTIVKDPMAHPGGSEVR